MVEDGAPLWGPGQGPSFQERLASKAYAQQLADWARQVEGLAEKGEPAVGL